jgi:hypothetical protein
MTDPKTTATNSPAQAVIGHNNPPDPIDDAIAPFGDLITEAETWADGTAVESEVQMRAVDALIKGMKSARKAVDDARDVATRPLHEAWKGEVARWKPTQDDLDRIVKCLVAAVDGFKRKLAAEKAEAERIAAQAAYAARKAAEDAAREAAASSDIEAQRRAAAAQDAMDAAQAAVQAAKADGVKGMRTYTVKTIVDGRAAAAWIWKNDRAAMDDFIARYVDRATGPIDGVEVRTEKRAV